MSSKGMYSVVGKVASHAEAWIETQTNLGRWRVLAGRLPRGGVD